MRLSKIGKYLSYARHGGVSGDTGFHTLFINVTSLCNAKCVHCEQRSLDHSLDLPTKRIIELIDEGAALGMTRLLLSGGEPFCQSDIWDILDHSFSKMREVGVLTNALVFKHMPSHRLEQLTRVSSIHISLDTHEPDMFNSIRGDDVFDRTIGAIQRLRRVGIPVYINAVITPENMPRLPAFAEFVSNLDVENVDFTPLHLWSNYHHVEQSSKTAGMFRLSAPELAHMEMYVDQALAVLKKHKQRSTLPAVAPWLRTYFGIQGEDANTIDKQWFTRIVKNFRCKPVYTRLFVQYDGGVVPCAMVPPVCSVRERPLKEAMDRLVEIQKRFESGKFLPDCYKCSCALPANYVFSLACSPLANLGEVTRYVVRSTR